ncbi:MAG: hypothetical protein R3F60_19390 [bacterium]
MPDRSRRDGPPRAVDLAAALQALAAHADALARSAGVAAPPAVSLLLPLEGPLDDRVARLDAALRQAIDAQRPAAWRDGRVLCPRCESLECAHAAPPGPTTVFGGYAPTGWPQWLDFTQVCVDRRVPGLDGIFADPPQIVGYVETAGLTAGLLPEYAAALEHWRPLGQVVVGPVPADPGRPRHAERHALTLQVVALERAGAPTSLRLNVLGLSAEVIVDAATEGPPRGIAEGLWRTLQQAHRLVARLNRRAGTAAARGTPSIGPAPCRRCWAACAPIWCASSEPRSWRTRHADDRHQAGGIPTETALGDAREAGDDRLYADTRRETVVVIGPRGRAHVFTPAGRHVTSLRLAPWRAGSPHRPRSLGPARAGRRPRLPRRAAGGGPVTRAPWALLAGLVACSSPAGPHLQRPIVESSGLIASARHPGIFWTHNDSGDSPRLFAVRADGQLVAEVQITGATHVDWEDIARDDQGHLYIGDFGNNRSVRADLCVYRLPEPSPIPGRAAVDRRLRFHYPDQVRWPDPEERFDAEALFWARGQLYLLTKRRQDARTVLYRFADLGSVDDQALVRVGEAALGGDPKWSRVTAADVTADGQRLAVLTYGALLLFERPAVGDDYLSGTPDRIELDPRRLEQCEAVAWEGDDLLITNEQGAIFRITAPRAWIGRRFGGEPEGP